MPPFLPSSIFSMMKGRCLLCYFRRHQQSPWNHCLFLIILSLYFYEASYAFHCQRKHYSFHFFQYKNNDSFCRHLTLSSTFILHPAYVYKLRTRFLSKVSSGEEKSKTSSSLAHASPGKFINYLIPKHDKDDSFGSNHSTLNDSVIGIILPLIVVLSLAVPQPQVVGERSVVASTSSEIADDEIAENISTELISRIGTLPIIDNIPIDDMTQAINNVVDGISSSIDDLPIESIIPNGQFISDVELISNKVIDAAVSTDPVDIFSIALGEGLAGLIGALATFLVGTMFMKDSQKGNNSIRKQMPLNIQPETDFQPEEDAYLGDLEESSLNTEDFFLAPSQDSYVDYNEQSWYSTVIPSKASERRDMVKGLVTEAVADSDYFLTKSAARNLFFALGIAPAAAELASVLLATVPFEFIKLSAKKSQLRQEENRLMDALLSEQQMNQNSQNKAGKLGIWTPFDGGSNSGNLAEEREREKIIETTNIIPGNINTLDFVELFSDVLKWLEYDVLDSDYSGSLRWNEDALNPGIESAIFGMIVSVSSNLYADITYRYTTFGPEAKRIESRARTYRGWIQKYVREAISTATLFGVYSAARFPIQKFLSELLSGGIEGCTGSKDFSLCMESYLTANPAMASKEAEIRSFLVALSSFIDRVRIDLDDGNVGWTELGRSLFVQLYSLLSNMFG